MLRASLITGLSKLNAKAEKRGEERSAGFKLAAGFDIRMARRG